MTRIVAAAVLFVALLSQSPTSVAQSIPLPEAIYGTNSVEFGPNYTDGSLVGCTLIYRALIRDYVYRIGEPSLVYGSFGLMTVKGQVGGVLKVVVEDFSVTNGKLITTPTQPARANIRTATGLTTTQSFVASSASDQPGGLFSVFRADENFINLLIASMESQKATVMFNRRAGGMDVPVELDLTVVATDEKGSRSRSPKPLVAFTECIGQLVK